MPAGLASQYGREVGDCAILTPYKAQLALLRRTFQQVGAWQGRRGSGLGSQAVQAPRRRAALVTAAAQAARRRHAGAPPVGGEAMRACAAARGLAAPAPAPQHYSDAHYVRT